jgi:hypothetical protein
MLEWLTLILLVPLVLIPCVLLFGFAGCDLVFPLRDPPPFKTSFEITLNQEVNLFNRCLVVRIEGAGDLLSISGQSVRLVLQRPQQGDLIIKDVYISQAADSGDPYDSPAAADGSLDATLVTPESTVSKDPDPASPDPAVHELVLDPVQFALDETKPLLIAMNIGSAGNIRFVANIAETNAQSYVGQEGLLEAAQPDRSSGTSYRKELRIYLIRRIEVA